MQYPGKTTVASSFETGLSQTRKTRFDHGTPAVLQESFNLPGTLSIGPSAPPVPLTDIDFANLALTSRNEGKTCREVIDSAPTAAGGAGTGSVRWVQARSIKRSKSAISRPGALNALYKDLPRPTSYQVKMVLVSYPFIAWSQAARSKRTNRPIFKNGITRRFIRVLI